MAFDSVPIGPGKGLPEGDEFLLALADASPAPRLKNTLGAVQQVLLPGDPNQLDLPAGLAELVPKFDVGGSPGVQLAMGSHAGVDVDESGALGLNGHGHLDVEIPDPPVCAAGIDAFWKQTRIDPELLEAGDFLLLGGQPGQVRMVHHEVERQQPPTGNLDRGFPAVTDIGDSELSVDGLAVDAVNQPPIGDLFDYERAAGNSGIE